MNKTELNKYKAMLEAKQAELSAGLRNREDIAIEKTPDAPGRSSARRRTRIGDPQFGPRIQPAPQREERPGTHRRRQLRDLPPLRGRDQTEAPGKRCRGRSSVSVARKPPTGTSLRANPAKRWMSSSRRNHTGTNGGRGRDSAPVVFSFCVFVATVAYSAHALALPVTRLIRFQQLCGIPSFSPLPAT